MIPTLDKVSVARTVGLPDLTYLQFTLTEKLVPILARIKTKGKSSLSYWPAVVHC